MDSEKTSTLVYFNCFSSREYVEHELFLTEIHYELHYLWYKETSSAVKLLANTPAHQAINMLSDMLGRPPEQS